MTDDAAMGDEVYQPTESETRDDPYELDLENSLDGYDADATLDEGYSPPEKPRAVNDPGTTARGQREGASLDERLAQETPDVRPPAGDGIGDLPGEEGEPLPETVEEGAVGDERAGRLVRATDESTLRPDPVAAEDAGIDGGAASAEEAAVHLTEPEGPLQESGE
ncbi:hypothetical protein FH609_027900 [Streptomyces sp. 3MP-14]|uniref:DUF5709 domain-containing protein n=1 Tax=Streptomyces mimosae TaxID=2586635 RepID=A0A5N5ZUX3_9ACTN|nr:MULTISPECIES: DUF5709 domain-containing protein [Streptomyces]KAB8160311.1 hypothetical protein FH607_027265 [Streptomyces mimosae]KAB8172927.1 hypothetical protein FH609_027900 [Streptomyces sp. 3MP-14]